MKQHPSDLVSLLFGTIFLTVVLFWLSSDVMDLDLPQPGWILAGALIFFGTLGVARTWRANRNDKGQQ